MSAASGNQRGPRYRRRRPLPALAVLAVLVVLSGFVWTRVFESTQTTETATQCNVPSRTPAKPAANATTPAAQPAALGQMLPRNGLDQSSPVPPNDVPVRVLNGNGESRQAKLVSSELTSLGFTDGGKATNDPVYVNYDLNCHGQIRFGGAGVSAARTLSLMAPCAQLVRDDRPDEGVDFALGTKFDDIKSTPEAKQVLQQLKNWTPQQDQQGTDQRVTPPQIDPHLLAAARDVHC